MECSAEARSAGAEPPTHFRNIERSSKCVVSFLPPSATGNIPHSLAVRLGFPRGIRQNVHDIQMNKIFVVGMNRAGNAALHALFQQNGLRSLQGEGYVDRIQDVPVNDYDAFLSCFAGNFSALPPLLTTYPNATFVWNFRNMRSQLLGIAASNYRKIVGHIPMKPKELFSTAQQVNQQNQMYNNIALKARLDAGDPSVIPNLLNQPFVDQVLAFRVQYYTKLGRWFLDLAIRKQVWLVDMDDPNALSALSLALGFTSPLPSPPNLEPIDDTILATLSHILDGYLSNSPHAAPNEALDRKLLSACMTATTPVSFSSLSFIPLQNSSSPSPSPDVTVQATDSEVNVPPTDSEVNVPSTDIIVLSPDITETSTS